MWWQYAIFNVQYLMCSVQNAAFKMQYSKDNVQNAMKSKVEPVSAKGA